MADTPVQPKLAHRLTTQDASFLYGESRNGPLHIGSVAIFEGEIDLEQTRRHVELRLHLIPRYRQRLSFVPFNLAHPTWEDDPNFAIERHVTHHQLAEGASEDDLIDAAMAVYEQPLPRDRPVWEMHLFGGLWGGRSGVVWKTHHCLVDGVSGMELLNVILDFRPDATAARAARKSVAAGIFPGPRKIVRPRRIRSGSRALGPCPPGDRADPEQKSRRRNGPPDRWRSARDREDGGAPDRRGAVECGVGDAGTIARMAQNLVCRHARDP